MVLRRFVEADLDDLAALHGNPDVMRYIDDGRAVPRVVVAKQALPAILREYQSLADGLGCFAAVDRESGGFLGQFSLRPANSVGLRGGTELGYRLTPEAWGHGYATEGARALVHMGFADCGVERVVATTMTVNVASRRVLEKVGLAFVRTFYEQWPEYLEGAEHGDVEYALAREVWEGGGR